MIAICTMVIIKITYLLDKVEEFKYSHKKFQHHLSTAILFDELPVVARLLAYGIGGFFPHHILLSYKMLME